MRMTYAQSYVMNTPIGHRYHTQISPMCVCLLFYAIATVFHLYHDGDMMYEMRRKPDLTLLLTQGIFKLLHRHGMRGTSL